MWYIWKVPEIKITLIATKVQSVFLEYVCEKQQRAKDIGEGMELYSKNSPMKMQTCPCISMQIYRRWIWNVVTFTGKKLQEALLKEHLRRKHDHNYYTDKQTKQTQPTQKTTT